MKQLLLTKLVSMKTILLLFSIEVLSEVKDCLEGLHNNVNLISIFMKDLMWVLNSLVLESDLVLVLASIIIVVRRVQKPLSQAISKWINKSYKTLSPKRLIRKQWFRRSCKHSKLIRITQ